MSRLSIPMNPFRNMDMDETLKIFKDMKTDRIFLACVERYPFKSNARRKKLLETCKTTHQFLKSEGFETALWIHTLGFGIKVDAHNYESAKNYTRRVTIMGETADDCMCPENEEFTEDLCTFVKEIAETGIEMLVLDDELCQSGVPGIGCACDLHMKKYQDLLGEQIAREELADKIFTGGPNKYRSAWFKMQGDTLRNFCRSLRKAADEVNPNMRMGFCAGYTSFDLEGADAIELTKILAGGTKPFLRYTGAPYWYAQKRFGHQSMQTIVEIVRQQVMWCENENIELFAEADSYPHNCFQVPSAYVEGFDLATKVLNNMDTLKYVVGYVSQPWYEKAYANEHINHLSLYGEIAKAFDDKKPLGIRIYQSMKVLENADFSNTFAGEDYFRNYWMNEQSSIIPTSAAIPTTYEGEGLCGMAFGEQAKYLPESAFRKGLILDIKAAKILQSQGIDVGLQSSAPLDYVPVERFHSYGTDTVLCWTSKVYDVKLKQGAKVLSTFYYEGIETPAAYLYENSAHQRFMVYGFDLEDLPCHSGALLSYCRGRQLNDCCEWLGGEKMPVICNGHPMLYCICKENESEIAAGYFNYHADEINNAEIKLTSNPSKVQFINCDGEVNGNTVTIRHIKSFGFAGIVFSKK